MIINVSTILGGRYGGIACTIYGTTTLAIQHYGFHNSGAAAEGAAPTVVEATEGRLHIGGWRDWWFHIWAIYPTISGSKSGAEITVILSGGLLTTAEGLLHNFEYMLLLVVMTLAW